MRFEYLIAARYMRSRRRERFVSLIAIISLAGVMIGTFALTVVLSVMSGFQENLRNRLLSFNPHITVEHTGVSPASLTELRARIARLPGVVGVAPFISSQVMVVSTTSGGAPGFVSGGTLRGVVAGRNPVLTELDRTLTAGSLATLARPHPVTITVHGKKRTVELPGAILGKDLAANLGLRLGDPLVVISPASLGAGAGEPRLRRFVVGGFFYSGMYEFDASLIFVALKDGAAPLADDPQLESGL